MIILTSLILSAFILILVLLTSIKWSSIFIEKPSNGEVRKIHDKNVLKIGGITLMSICLLYFYIDSFELKMTILFSIPVFIIGFIDDLFNFPNARIRAILLLIIIIFFLITINISIDQIQIEWIDSYILSISLISITFTSLGILLLTNGFNIIDGQHGLMLGTSLLIVTSLYQFIPGEFYELEVFLKFILTSITFLFILNFVTGKIMSGDCGSNFLGFLISGVIIYSYNNFYLDPFYIACILSYPIIELLFSFFRRAWVSKNPFKPDEKHLHSLVFKRLKRLKLLVSIPKDIINRFTSLIILLFILLSILFIHSPYSLLVGYKTILLVNILTYISFYFVLRSD